MSKIETPKEPEVIAELRGWHREGCESLFTIGEVLAVDIPAILAAYDTIVAERDAVVQSIEKARDYGHRMDALAEERAIEAQKLRNRLAACERVVEAAKTVIADADTAFFHSDNVERLRAAVAAETQGEA